MGPCNQAGHAKEGGIQAGEDPEAPTGQIRETGGKEQGSRPVVAGEALRRIVLERHPGNFLGKTDAIVHYKGGA